MTSETEPRSTLIFLCVANSARSQIAEGLSRATAPQGWRIFSAGSQPGLVHPLAIEVLREIDIDIGDHRSKGLDEVPIDEADVIVTLCEEEVCPVVHGPAKRLHWPLPDPASEGEMIRYQLDAFRSARDEIKQRLQSLWTEHPIKD
jgi:arsenate reductase